MMRDALVIFAIGLLWTSQGCTIAGQYGNIKDTQQRVDIKTDELQHEEETQAALQSQMHQLNADLATQQMTATQLDARLATLQAQNRRLAADNDKKRHQRDALEKDLTSFRTQLKALKASNAADAQQASQDSAAAAAEHAAQQRQLDDLRARVRVRLASLAND